MVTVEVVGDSDPEHDVAYEFVRQDLADLDIAVEELVDQSRRAREGDRVEISRRAWLRWKAERQVWEPTETFRRIRRVEPPQ